jgi:GNAT superfamily N-acetyltransferase
MPVQTVLQVIVRRLTTEDQPLLEEMYDVLAPLGQALGLPPQDAAQRREWLVSLHDGMNFGAFAEGKLAGHLALLPDDETAEVMCFVHPQFRRQGVATALVHAAAEAARAAGCHSISVFIDTHNMGARHGLLRFGFQAVWEDLEEAEYSFAL